MCKRFIKLQLQAEGEALSKQRNTLLTGNNFSCFYLDTFYTNFVSELGMGLVAQLTSMPIDQRLEKMMNSNLFLCVEVSRHEVTQRETRDRNQSRHESNPRLARN